MAGVFLEARNIVKTFGGVQALKGVDLTIREGEIHCLAGENGCGKSTLIKTIMGVHQPDSGEILIEGKICRGLSPIEAIRHGIQVIYQDFSLFANLSVAENIALNQELQSGKKIVNWKEVHKIAGNAMENLGIHLDMNMPVSRLTIANKQMVAICRALINESKLIIMDEPTTALTAKEVQRLFGIIRRLSEKGIAVLIVNHKLEEVYEIADTLTIFRNGKNVETGKIKEFDRRRFVKCMTGHDLEEVSYRPKSGSKTIVRVEHLTKKGVFQDVSFTVKENDILGITGLLGSGRGEIGDALFGILPADSGKIELLGQEVKINSVADAMKHKISYVPEDRLTQGLFLEQSIGDNIVIAAIKKYVRGFGLNETAMKVQMKEWLEKLHVLAYSPEPEVKTLSGGNQQKVVLAKWLNNNPSLMILNGPTVGVDIGSKNEIHSILRDLAESGIGVIIISDDLPELIDNCNKILVMKQGKTAGYLEAEDFCEDELLAMLKEG